MSEILKFIEFNQYNLPLFIKILAIYLVVLWLAVVAWVIRDITTRSSNILIISGVILLVVIGNLPGLIIYLLLRPDKTIEEGKNKDLFFASVLDSNINVCAHCHNLVRTDFQYCPYCSSEVNLKCPHCSKIVNASWKYCVYCNTPLFSAPKISEVFSTIGLGIKKFFSFPGKILNFVGSLVTKIKLARKIPGKLSLPKFKLEFPKLRLPSFKTTVPPVKVLAAQKTETKLKTKVRVAPVPEIPQAKRGRGRPRGTSDHKPRKPRADAGKKRGKYSKNS